MSEIDWDTVGVCLGTHESPDDPEAITHELCHMFLCKGEAGLGHIGTQPEVADVIEEKFRNDVSGYHRHEVETTALTFLVLQPLGLADLADQMAKMHKNISSLYKRTHTPIDINEMFLEDVGHPVLIAGAKRIRQFLFEASRGLA